MSNLESDIVKMEIELTPEQYDKVVDLKVHGLGYGDAIDLLFKVKLEVLAQVESIGDNIAVYDKVKDPSLGIDQKREILEDEYGDIDKTFESQVQMTKNKLSWAREIFNF